MFPSMRSSRFSSSLHAANAFCSRAGSVVGFAPSPLPGGRTSPAGVSKSNSSWYKVSWFCLSTFMSFGLFCAVLDFGLPHQGLGTMPLLTTCFRAFLSRHPFRPWQVPTEYDYATFLPRRLHLPCGFLMMYRISALVATSSIHPASICNFCPCSLDFLLPLPRFVSFPKLLRARPTGAHPCGAKPPVLANQPYSRRLLCSSGLGFRIIAAPRGLSPQCAFRVGRTTARPLTAGAKRGLGF